MAISFVNTDRRERNLRWNRETRTKALDLATLSLCSAKGQLSFAVPACKTVTGSRGLCEEFVCMNGRLQTVEDNLTLDDKTC